MMHSPQAWIESFKRTLWTTNGKDNLLTALVSCNVFALFVGGLYEYLSLRGIASSVFAARLVLLFIGLVAIVGIFTSNYLWGNEIKHRKWWAIASVVFVISLLVSVDAWANALKTREARIDAEDYRRYGWVSFTQNFTENGQGDSGNLVQMQVWLGNTKTKFKDVKLTVLNQSAEGLLINSDDLTGGLHVFATGFATLIYRIAPGTQKIETCLTVPSQKAETSRIIQDFKVVAMDGRSEIMPAGDPKVQAAGIDEAQHACKGEEPKPD